MATVNVPLTDPQLEKYCMDSCPLAVPEPIKYAKRAPAKESRTPIRILLLFIKVLLIFVVMLSKDKL